MTARKEWGFFNRLTRSESPDVKEESISPIEINQQDHDPNVNMDQNRATSRENKSYAPPEERDGDHRPTLFSRLTHAIELKYPSGIKLSQDSHGNVLRCLNFTSSLLICVFLVMPSPGKAQSFADEKVHLKFLRLMIQELQDRQYDLLETQYREFHPFGQETADGIPKLWLYFAAFYEQNRDFATDLAEAKLSLRKHVLGTS